MAAPALTVPSAGVQLALIRGTLEALNQANLTGNYGVFYQLASDTFRAANPPETVPAAFARFREQRVSLTPALVLSPQLSVPAVISGGQLRLSGLFASQPNRIVFDMAFAPVQGSWRLAAFKLQLSPAPVSAGQALQAGPARPAARPEARPEARQGKPVSEAPKAAAPVKPR